MTAARLVPIFAFILTCWIIQAAWSARRVQKRRENISWDDLLAQLRPVGKVGIEEVAGIFLFPSSEQMDARCSDSQIDTRDVWDYIGGIEGIETMRHNAEILIELAYYVQRWNPQACLIAEQLRLDANQIKTSLAKIRASRRQETFSSSFQIHATRATAAYYLMTRRLCALYEVSNAGLLDRLKASM